MIKVSVMYPNTDGATFDMAYYFEKHLPMVRALLGPALKGVAAEQGLAGGAPGTPPPYILLCHLMFDSVEAFQQAFAPHAAEILHEHAADRADRRGQAVGEASQVDRRL